MHNLETPVWSNDSKSVYYMKSLVRGADPKSFEVLLGLYARDANHIYFGTSKCPKIDRSTFRPLNACFGVDASSAYFCIAPVKQANPTTFRPLDSGLAHNGSKHCSGDFLRAGYCADENAVWFCSGGGVLRLKAAEPATFISLGNRFGHDRERVYYENTLIAGVHRPTWRHWSGLLSTDKDNVFFAEKRIEGVHRASAILLEVQDCFMDRNQVYSGWNAISADQYLNRLKYVEEACARERKGLADGSMFQRLLSEWPKHF